MTGGSVYHVVCRECPTEALRRTADEAETAATSHVTRTDHSVAVERIE